MFISHGIWLLRTRRLRQRAKEAGLKFDEFPEAVEWQSKGIDVCPDTVWKRITEKTRSTV